VQNEGKKLPSPIGLVWGGTVNHGRLKLRTGVGPENWTSGIGLARLMDLLDVDLVTSLDSKGPSRRKPFSLDHFLFSTFFCAKKKI
jgi:hypothetical protein